jgi:hypothetical protein
LPLAADGLHATYADLFTPLKVPALPFELRSIAILFELALGMSTVIVALLFAPALLAIVRTTKA